MNIEQKSYGYSSTTIIGYFALIMTLMMLSTSCLAQIQATIYTTPSSLTKAKTKNSQQALVLLTSDIFHQELKQLAEQLPTKTIEQAGMFNKVALFSI